MHLALAAIAAISALWLPGSARADFAFSPAATLAGPPASAPDLAADSQGRTTIVWQEMADDGVTRLIQSTRLNADGTREPVRTLTSMTSGPGCSCPQVVIDPQGRATVAWIAGVSPSDRNRVQAVQLDEAQGLPLGPVRTLSPAGDEAAWHRAAVDSQGRTTIVWLVPGPIDRVDSARLLADGAAEPVQTVSEPEVNSRIPGIAVDREDRATIAWGSSDGLQLVRLGTDGAPGPVQTILPPEAHATIPEILVDSQNRLTIVHWVSAGFDTKAVRVDPDGTVGPVLNVSAADENTFEASVAIDSVDRVTAVWHSFSGQIKTARIEADGTVGPVRIVSDPDLHRVGNPQIAIGPEDRAVVVWAHDAPTFIERLPRPECEEFPFEPEPESDVVQAAFIGDDGIPGPIHYLSAFGQQSIVPAVAADPFGRVTVVWHSYDGTYLCIGAETRLQMSWGPWTEPVDPPPPPPPEPLPPKQAPPDSTAPVPPPDPPHVVSAVRLARRGVLQRRFVAVRGVCLGAQGSACDSRVKLLGPAKDVIASGRVRLAGGAKRVLRLRLSRHGRALLARVDSGPIRATVEGVAVTSSRLSIVPRSRGAL